MDDPLIGLGSAMARFAELASEAIGDEPVPSCPGWSVADLVTHLGGVHRWAAAIVLSGQRLQPPQVHAQLPLAEWYAGTATALLTALQAVDGDEPTPNFSRRDEVAAFWPRRQLHETTVHAVDLAQALGRPEYGWDVDAEIAADGIAEVIRIFLPRMAARGTPTTLAAPIELRATDVDRTWIIGPKAPGGDVPVLITSDTDVEGMAQGTATELYLALWNRLPSDRLDITGLASDFFSGPRVP